MTHTQCKWCGKPVERLGEKAGVFCSLDCKGAWQQTQKPVDREWLEQKYTVEKLSTYAIAKLVHRNPKQVYQWLKRYGIPTRPRGGPPGPRGYDGRNTAPDHPTQPYQDPQWLENEYVAKQRSAADIARDFGISDAAIIHWLRKLSIPRRSTAETRKIKHWGCPGAQNPMYGKTGILNKNWKGGLTPFRQQIYGSVDWAPFARKIRRRDKVCRLCGSDELCHIHHIEPVSKAPLLIMDEYNVILLCIDCHHKVSRREWWWRKRLYALVLQKAS